jgi:small subunit ribosomal protein S16
MLVIRMQRTGRKGHAMFRVVVQDSRRTPTSGKVVAQLGSYDPHAKVITLNKEKTIFYLEHGAQPSERATRLIAGEGIKLPDWVKTSSVKQRTVRNADKRRSTSPAPVVEEAEPVVEVEAAPEVVEEAPTEVVEEAVSETPAEAAEEAEAPAEEAAPAAEETPEAEA